MELSIDVLIAMANLADKLGKVDSEGEYIKFNIEILKSNITTILMDAAKDTETIFKDSPEGELARKDYFISSANIYGMGVMMAHINEHLENTNATTTEVTDAIAKLIFIEECGILERSDHPKWLRDEANNWITQFEQSEIFELVSHIMQDHFGIKIVTAELTEDSLSEIENYANQEKD